MKILSALALFFLSSCSTINGYLGLSDDHDAEEIAEQAIEQKTGLDIDLTPSTPEAK